MRDDAPLSKKAQILNTLADMLAQPHAGRVTTAALAQRLNNSEAALYRHFAGKAAMFEGLIAQIRAQLLEDLAHVQTTENNGRLRLRKQLHALLLFTERHRGMTRVLAGDALATEAPHLQTQVNELMAEIEAVLAGSAQAAMEARAPISEKPGGATSESAAAASAQARLYACALAAWVQGRWMRYAQTGWQALPTEDHARQLDLLGLGTPTR